VFNHWLKLGYDTTMLALEAQQVIALRLMKLASGGPDAAAEAYRMVAEKQDALGEASAQIMSGASARTVVKGYRRTVHANRVRLGDEF
jgi:hypothetical protein